MPARRFNYMIIINNCWLLTEFYRVGLEQVRREAGLDSQCLLGQASLTSLTNCVPPCPSVDVNVHNISKQLKDKVMAP